MCPLLHHPSSLSQVMEELKRLLAYYKRELGETPELLGLALSARKNLCIHPEVGVLCGGS